MGATDGIIRPARRVRDIRYAVRDVVVLADELRRSGKEMFYLNIGDPNIYGFAPPEHLVQATVDAMRRNRNGYAPSDGIDEAVEAIERDARARGIFDPNYTWVGSGCSEVIDMALTALVDPGEEVLTPAPGYPLYTALISKLEAKNVGYYLDEDRGWEPDVDDIAKKITEKTRALVVINPNNPTGSVASDATLRRLVDLCAENNIVLFADEIYDRLLFSGRTHTPMGSLREDAVVLSLGGLSKNWVVPGFRIGWGMLTGPEEKTRAYKNGIQQLGRARLSANHPEQFAIKPSLEGPQDHITVMLAALEERTALAMDRLNAIDGISCVAPSGAFYAFPRIDIDGVEDAKFCRELMVETGVVVVPGSGFGQKPGTQHFRIVTLPPLEIIDRACDGIARFVERSR